MGKILKSVDALILPDVASNNNPVHNPMGGDNQNNSLNGVILVL